jgi:hypothetical protein
VDLDSLELADLDKTAQRLILSLIKENERLVGTLAGKEHQITLLRLEIARKDCEIRSLKGEVNVFGHVG